MWAGNPGLSETRASKARPKINGGGVDFAARRSTYKSQPAARGVYLAACTRAACARGGVRARAECTLAARARAACARATCAYDRPPAGRVSFTFMLKCADGIALGTESKEQFS